MPWAFSLLFLALSVGRDISHGTFRVVEHGCGYRWTGDRRVVALLVGIGSESPAAATGALRNIGRPIAWHDGATTSSERENDH